ncbi:MAG TPA: R3H domain-containing nucleic acid-binding protein [Myxococcota bacterium]|nr:R3H domain-containing nucleic acid-binding protein [Myxococcota bacterium]
MYDASTEPREFVGLDRAEAVGKACGYFRLREDELSIHEFDPKEIYGLASRTVVVAAPAGRQARESSHGGAAREEGRGRRGRDGGGERDRDRGRGDGRSGGRGDRGGRGGDRERGGQRSEGRGGRPSEAREAREPRDEDRRPARPAVSSEPSVGTAQGALGEIGSFVLGAVERMGLGPFEISETAEEGVIVIALQGPGARALGSGDGRPVDALQMLANQAAMRLSEEPDRIVLDVEGDLEEREARLTELASRAARRARETGRAIALDPMSPRDRRAVHLALRDAQGVATMSVGESRFRQVVVVPEGAPEYEDAVRESRAAATADEGA